MIDALDYGDGVSNDAINIHLQLDKEGIENQIYSKYHHPTVSEYCELLDMYQPKRDDVILYHFSGKSEIMEKVLGYGRKTVLRYHNVTPPHFFKNQNDKLAHGCQEGINQVLENIHRFDFYLADSDYNGSDLISYGADPTRVETLPIFMNLDGLREVKTEPQIVAEMKQHHSILFVGRIAPNKCIEDILDVFEQYHLFYDHDACLYLVGNKQQNPYYTEQLEQKMDQLWCSDHVLMTDKVDDDILYSYYTGADAFICMSEHEGFCIPLLEAMTFQIPVMAFDAGAVSKTMGNSGILLRRKNVPYVAALLDKVVTNRYLRYRVLQAQNEHILEFSGEVLVARLLHLLTNWLAC